MTKINTFVALLILLLPAIGLADEYMLVMSKDDNVCQHMHRLYNDDIKKYGEIKYDQHEEFNAIEWGDKKFYRIRDGKKEYPKEAVESHTTVQISYYDINNDGKEEIVIKQEGYYKGIQSDNVHYFKNEDASLFQEDAFDIKILYNKSTGNISSGGGNIYELKELPKFIYSGIDNKDTKAYYSLGAYIYVNPFLFAGTYYLDLKDEVPYDFKNMYSSNFLIILKYTKENQRQDACYFVKIADCNKSQKLKSRKKEK